MYWYALVCTMHSGMSTVYTSMYRLGGLTMEETALKKSAVRVEQAKRSAETRRRWKAAGATSKRSVCVVDVYTSGCTYQYVPGRTYLYMHYLNFAFFEIRRHPIISVA